MLAPNCINVELITLYPNTAERALSEKKKCYGVDHHT
jgi:hypothetical protein